MPERGVGVTDVANAAGVIEIGIVETPSSTIRTTLTADPTTGTAIAVANRSLLPQSGEFKIRMEGEVALVTAGHGAGAGTFTATRGQDGTSNVAHAIGVVVAQVMGIQIVNNIDASRIVSFKGRANSLRIPARAATTQNLLSLHNATGSLVKVRVNRVWTDKISAAAAGVAPTVIAPLLRLYKVTVLPSLGTAMTKVAQDSLLASNASVTVLNDASADGTSSASALTATLPAGNIWSECFVPRTLVVGTSASTFTELFDREVFLESDSDFITLNALEGVVLQISAPAAMVVTDHYVAGIEWEEYTAT